MRTTPIIYIIILLLNKSSIFPQSISLNNILKAINFKYNNLSTYSYELSSSFIPVIGSEIMSFQSRVYVNKLNPTGTISKFIIINNERVQWAFDGDYLISLDTFGKINHLYKDYAINKISSGPINWSSYSPYLFTNSIIDLTKWNEDKSDYSISYNGDEIEIKMRNSYENKHSYFDNSPKVGTSELTLKININDTLIRSITEIVKVTPKSQITNFQFKGYKIYSKLNEFDSVYSKYFVQLKDSKLKSTVIKKQERVNTFKINEYFPDTIAIINLSNNSYNLKDFKKRYVLIDFWFKACVPCIQASKIVNNIHSQFSTHTNFISIGINVLDTSSNTVSDYAKSHNLKFDQYFTQNREYSSLFTGYGFPIILLYDLKENKIKYFAEGIQENTESKIRESIISLE